MSDEKTTSQKFIELEHRYMLARREAEEKATNDLMQSFVNSHEADFNEWVKKTQNQRREKQS